MTNFVCNGESIMWIPINCLKISFFRKIYNPTSCIVFSFSATGQKRYESIPNFIFLLKTIEHLLNIHHLWKFWHNSYFR